MTWTRRDFSRSAASLAVAPLVARKRVPVALELWSIRRECEKDFPGSLAAVAKMGYEGVEFGDYFHWSAKDLRKIIDDLGLAATSSHVAYKLLSEEFDKTVEFQQELGVSLLIVPGYQSKTAEAGSGLPAS